MPNSDAVNDNIERLSRMIHQIYCKTYAHVYGEEYWTKGNYDLLAESTKEFDRAIARFILENFAPKTNLY
jgi:hypothetical protein